jgi:hypothetical protein
MSKAKSADEISNKDIAAEVITPKRKYFFPDKQITVEIPVGDDDNKNMENAIAAAEKAEKGEADAVVGDATDGTDKDTATEGDE